MDVMGAQMERARNVGSGAAVGKLADPQAISYGEQIAHELKQAEQRVVELKRIQEILAKNPEFEELLTLVGRRRY